MNPFYRFTCEAGDDPASAELLIFDAIGSWEEIGEVSAKGFAKALAGLPSSVKRLDIHINSPGGSVYDAQGIYSRLADHRAEKIVYIDGLAASAASIVAMVGKKIYIRANANMMIHLPMAITMGNEEDHEKSIRALKSITGGMVNAYAKKTGLERGEIRDMLAAETWFTAEEAVEKGFADEVRGVIKAAATADPHRAIFNGVEFDLSRFKNVPAFTAEQPKGKRTMEKPKAAAGQEDPPKPKTGDEGSGNGGEGNGNGNGNGDEGAGKEGKGKEKEGTGAAAQAPAPPPAGVAATHEDGVKAERARVLALQELDRPATHDIITAAIKDGKTVADVVGACMAAMDKANAQSARRTDARSLDGIPGSDGGAGNGEESFGGLIKKKVVARVKGRNPLRVHSRN